MTRAGGGGKGERRSAPLNESRRLSVIKSVGPEAQLPGLDQIPAPLYSRSHDLGTLVNLTRLSFLLYGPRVPSFPTHDGKVCTFTLPPPGLCRPRHGRPAPSPGPLNPDHEGGGDRSQQVPPTSSQAVPRLQDQVPTAPPGPPSPAQATLHHLEAQHLLLGAALCPWGCPNKT